MMDYTNMFSTSFDQKKKVLLRGPVLTQSGYGVHVRQVAKWLLKRDDISLHVQALPWGDTPWILNRDFDNGLIGSLMDKTVDPSQGAYDLTFQLQLPNEWDTKLGKNNIGITAGVETDKCNPHWVKCCNAMSAVVVPSKHVEDSFRNTGNIATKIFTIPEAYSEEISKSEKTRVDDLRFSTPFNFLLFGQITGNNPENDRKNIFYTIKWFCETFSNDPEVGLVIKTNAGRNTKIDRRAVSQMLTGLLGEVRKGANPRIHFLHGDMSNSEVASLYRHPQIKALISLTRGEGYGLPILEAAASGLPIIATKWSGHTDFLSHGKYIEVDYNLSQIHPTRVDNNIFVQGSRWANPIEDDFKKKIVKFRNNSEIPREWAAELREKILEKYSIESISNSYQENLRGFF